MFDEGYFNFYSRVADGWWERRYFMGVWRRLHRRDRRWTPPYYPQFSAALTPGRMEHLDRQRLALIYVEAMPGQPNYSGEFNHRRITSGFMEEPVAAAILLADPRRREGTAALGLLGCANDVESLERLLGVAQEQAAQRGCSRIVGPTHFSPYLGHGALLDHFNLPPPLYTPYNPPYLPEVLDAVLERVQLARLYYGEVQATPADHTQPARLRPITPEDYASLLPRLLRSLDSVGEFPAPDGSEAEFLLQWWGIWPLLGYIAEVDAQPVGLVLLQPDLAQPLRAAKGGRNPFWRPWLSWRSHQRTRSGRILALTVMPQRRGQGIGRQLYRAGVALAHTRGWRTVTVGPVVNDSPGAAFLNAMGAQAMQRYQLYATE